MAHEILQIRSVHPTQGYSHCARAGDTLYVAGQVALDAQGHLVGRGDFEAQAHQVFRNLQAVLEEAGASLGHIVKTTTLLTHPGNVEAYRTVRNSHLAEPMPPNTLLIIDSLANKDFLIEIEAVAALD